MICLRVADFSEWRTKARALLLAQVAPGEVVWEGADQELLFEESIPAPVPGTQPRVPPAFLESAERAACYRGDEKWSVLYRVLWRLIHENRLLLDLASDDDVRQLRTLEGEVRRDAHKMKAFVRFRQVGEDYIAWHQPAHLVLERTAPFFARRFASMRWAILTPDCCAYWDLKELRFGPGVARSQAPTEDAMEELWKTYYSHIFNPARLKLQAMRSEMPLKYWHTMPETALIPGLVKGAMARVEKMVDVSTKLEERPDLWTAKLLETGAPLAEFASAALRCRGCELCERATQTVFGTGPATAALMLIGEQPGEQEDKRGAPFVGPAGAILRKTLEAMGAPAEEIYMTNSVKHFHWEPGPAGRPLHKRASKAQIEVCKPWVQAEIELVKPRVIVCLGATAAQALISRDFRLSRERGKWVESPLAPRVMATFHPSFLLRNDDQANREMFDADLRMAWEMASASPGAGG